MYIVRIGRFSAGSTTTPLPEGTPLFKAHTTTSSLPEILKPEGELIPVIGILALSNALGNGSFRGLLLSESVGAYNLIPVQLLPGELVKAFGATLKSIRCALVSADAKRSQYWRGSGSSRHTRKNGPPILVNSETSVESCASVTWRDSRFCRSVFKSVRSVAASFSACAARSFNAEIIRLLSAFLMFCATNSPASPASNISQESLPSREKYCQSLTLDGGHSCTPSPTTPIMTNINDHPSIQSQNEAFDTSGDISSMLRSTAAREKRRAYWFGFAMFLILCARFIFLVCPRAGGRPHP